MEERVDLDWLVLYLFFTALQSTRLVFWAGNASVMRLWYRHDYLISKRLKGFAGPELLHRRKRFFSPVIIVQPTILSVKTSRAA